MRTAARSVTVNAEDLVGARVFARNGRVVGHIEEMRCERRHGDYVITEFLMGSGALRERFSIVRQTIARRRTIVVRWDQIDLSNPARPVLTCHAAELARAE